MKSNQVRKGLLPLNEDSQMMEHRDEIPLIDQPVDLANVSILSEQSYKLSDKTTQQHQKDNQNMIFRPIIGTDLEEVSNALLQLAQ